MSKLSTELLKLFRYVSLNDKRKVELTCYTIKDVCSGVTHGKNEKFTFYEQGSWFPRLIIEKFDERVPNLKLTAMMDMRKIPEEIWKDYGSKIHSIKILQNNVEHNDHSDEAAIMESDSDIAVPSKSDDKFYSTLDNIR